MSEKGEYAKFKNYETKIKSPFMIYVDFESILVPEDLESKTQMRLIQTNIKNM